MQLFLVGFQKSGKTTLGKKMASFLNVPFFDVDELIKAEKKAETVREVYKELGEEEFRHLEERILENIPYQPSIVATGGGTPISKANQSLLKKKQKVIYLKTKPHILYNRLFEHGVPLYLNQQDPRSHFFDLYAERILIYSQVAHDELCMDDLSEEAALKKLVEIYGK